MWTAFAYYYCFLVSTDIFFPILFFTEAPKQNNKSLQYQNDIKMTRKWSLTMTIVIYQSFTIYVNVILTLLRFAVLIGSIFTNCRESERSDKNGTQSCTSKSLKLRGVVYRAVHMDEGTFGIVR